MNQNDFATIKPRRNWHLGWVCSAILLTLLSFVAGILADRSCIFIRSIFNGYEPQWLSRHQ